MNETKKLALNGLLGLTLAAGAVVQPLQAQETPAAGDTELEEVSITGSRIRGAAPVGSPVQFIDRAAIENANVVSVDRLIQQTPQVFDLGVSEGSRGQNGGAGNIVYGNGVNLRGIGPFATLVLLDGHRAVSNSRSIDPSIIPALGLERVEVLTDGASAVYGSDAIAGVVNLIPRRFEAGGTVSARYGFADNYNEHNIGFAFGKIWTGGQFHIAYENGLRDNLNGADRDFFRANQVSRGGRDYRTTFCDPGNISVAGSPTVYPIPIGGVTPASRAALVAGTANRCEQQLYMDLLPEQKYNGVAITLNQKLGERFEFFSDGFFADRKFEREVGYTATTLTVPITNAFYVLPAALTTPVPETVLYQFTELPRDGTRGFSRSYELTTGLRASLPFEWRAEVLATYGKNTDKSASIRGLNTVALNAALASNNTATAFDPYGLHRTSATVLAGIADQIFISDTDTDLRGYEARFDGPVFALPGGEVRVAAGYERQEQTYDTGLARGGPTTQSAVRSFGRDVNSGYLEVYVPIFGASNATSGFKRLELNAAIRYDDYSDVGDTTNPKIGINYSPVDDVTLRASYGTSLRAPIFPEIYGNSNNLFVQAYADPTAGNAIIQGAALSGGNLGLEPEEATTYSYGIDYTPSFLDGAKLSLTYFDIEYEKQIVAYLSDTSILNRESLFAGTGIILRGAAAQARITELLAAGITVARGSLPATVFVDGRSNNLGVSTIKGFDFAVSYGWQSDGMGAFNASVGGTYNTTYDTSITPLAPVIDQLDTIANPLALKLRAQLGWSLARYRAQVIVSHVGGYSNTLTSPNEAVQGYTPVDLNFSVLLGDPDSTSFFKGGFTLGVDARNVFDSDPPYVNLSPNVNGSGGYDATTTNPVGRVIGVSLRKKF